MAAGFKQATVNAASVPSTQTNFPAYVDLSRLGITTLAEAQSVRVYADSGKVTEWAREIVSATEMHVKVPSLTSTVTMYVDWDGVSADYAVTDTYGRNAVWSSYSTVIHNGGATDSTGNSTLSANGGVTPGGVSGKVGDATDYDGSNDYITGASNMDNDTSHTIQAWLNPDVINTRMGIFAVSDGVSNATSAWVVENRDSNNGSFDYKIFSGGTSNSLLSPASTLVASAWNKFDFVRSGGALAIYKNASSVASSTGGTTGATNNRTSDFGLGRFGSGNFLYYNGKVDEFRYISTNLSANWLTTEYNNQNDEATFWGTWTTVGGGATPTPLLSLMGVGS